MRWRDLAVGRTAAPDDLDRSFAALVSADGARAPSIPRVGIEHEYQIVGPDGPVDFRGVLPDLDLGVAHLDPRDAFGFRRPSGTWLTSDEAEAEVAMPPVRLAAGFGTAIASTAADARADLERLLPRVLRADGFSTHINVSAPEERRNQTARLFARTFAPALMLLMDRPMSPGLLVRSRPGRIELGGEFADGNDLVAAALLAAGGVLACLRRVSGRLRARDLPPELVVDPAPEWRRYGWYVNRRAFGSDLYTGGRQTILATANGESVTAQAQLVEAWRAARRELPRGIDRPDLELVDAIAQGERPLPLEMRRESRLDARRDDGMSSSGEVYASAIRPRLRRWFELGAVLATWELTVFVVVDRARTRRAFACVPDTFLERFLALLDRGQLDAIVERYLRASPAARLLGDRSQARRPGLWDQLGARRALLRPEFRPQGTRP